MTSIYPSQTRTLTLHTYAITQRPIDGYSAPEPNNPYRSASGYANDKLTSVTWTGVSLRRVLDDVLYYKYKRFNLVLRQFATDACGAIGKFTDPNETLNERSLSINVTGPNWAHNYVVANRTTSATARFASIVVPYDPTHSDESVCEYFDSNAMRTFTVDGLETIDITVSILRTVDNQPPLLSGVADALPATYPNWVCVFDIYPVLDSKIDENNAQP